MRKILLISLIVLSLGVLHISAQDSVDDQDNPNNPDTNDRANACYEGGTLEGQCTSEALWQAGWYLIRVEFDIFNRSDVPTWVAWVLPPEVVPEEIVPSPVDPIQCYTDGSKSFVFDANQLSVDLGVGGMVVYNNTDCSSGVIVTLTTLITPIDVFMILPATDNTEAMTQCMATFSAPGTTNHRTQSVISFGYNTPANWYACGADTGPILGP